MEQKIYNFTPLQFPNDYLANRSRIVYLTEKAINDINVKTSQNLFPEVFDLNATNQLTKYPERLNKLVIRVLANNYDGGQLNDAYYSDYDKILFGELLSVDIDIEKVIDFDNDVYWRRVVEKFSHRKTEFLKVMMLESNNVSLKPIGLELKFARLLETLAYASWNSESLTELAKKLSPFIRMLKIHSLNPMKDFMLERNAHNSNYKIFNYSDSNFNHGNLSFLSQLQSLTTLTINFATENLRYDYHKRFFELSCDDISNLANGICQLSSLRSLTLRGNKLNDKKMVMLMNGLSTSHIEILDLSFCQLDAFAIRSLAVFLCENEHNSLQCLELKGNCLTGVELTDFGAGLTMYKGELKYLGLSQNPLNDDGVVAIVNGLREMEHLNKIDFSSCEMGTIGVREIIELLRLKSLKSLNISSIIVQDQHATELIQRMESNFNMEQLECRNCGLTLEQERGIRLLLERNVYYIKHPCLFKEHFTEDDEKQIDDKLANWRHLLFDRIEDEASKFGHNDEIIRSKYHQNFLTEEKFCETARI